MQKIILIYIQSKRIYIKNRHENLVLVPLFFFQTLAD